VDRYFPYYQRKKRARRKEWKLKTLLYHKKKLLRKEGKESLL